MAKSLEQFAQLVADSTLMSADDIRAVIAGVLAEQQPQDGGQLARLLVNLKKLTAYQVQEIQLGKGRSLVLGNYVILEKLGQGGMGMVLKAEHRRMERTVAIKIISPSVTENPEAVRRFQREVKACAKLEHPNIVTAHDADEANGTHFLVMQFVEGTDLAALVRKQGPLPVEKAVPCVLQAARGLSYAHSRGMVHRDIKPANLLLDHAGTVKILDMGIVRLESAGIEGDELTGTGQIVGTVDYMAPEQAMESKTVDARADIYSLGITLWFLLTGRVVYKGDTVVKKLMAHQNSPIPSLRGACTQASPQLEMVFAKMVAKTPESRYQSMVEVIAALEQSLDGRNVGPSTFNDSGREDRQRGFHPGGDVSVQPAVEKLAVSVLTPNPTAIVPSSQVDTDLHHSDVFRQQVDRGKDAKLVDVPPPMVIAPFDATTAKEHQSGWAKHLGVQVAETNTLGMALVLIPPGRFTMGSPVGEIGRSDNEGQVTVTLTRPLHVGKSAVTQSQWRTVMSTQPWRGEKNVREGDDCPATFVSWEDAVEFCEKLGAKEGVEYRLLTEAEWEYACRAGTESRFGCGDDESHFGRYAWFAQNTYQVNETHAHRVGLKKPNPFGLHDLHGNVWEWCQDWYGEKLPGGENPVGTHEGLYRVFRGGGWSFCAARCRSASRYWYSPFNRFLYLGFRVARVVSSK